MEAAFRFVVAPLGVSGRWTRFVTSGQGYMLSSNAGIRYTRSGIGTIY